MANVGMVKIIMISWVLVKNCCPDFFRKRQREYLTLVLLFLSAHTYQSHAGTGALECEFPNSRSFSNTSHFEDTICEMSTGLTCNDWVRENELITSCYWKSIVYKLQRKLTRIQCTGDFKMLFRVHWFVNLGFKCKNLQCGVVLQRWCSTNHIKCLHRLLQE